MTTIRLRVLPFLLTAAIAPLHANSTPTVDQVIARYVEARGGSEALAGKLYVSPTGEDVNPGTKEKPFATLERARDEIRRVKAVSIDDLRSYLDQYPRDQLSVVTLGPKELSAV